MSQRHNRIDLFDTRRRRHYKRRRNWGQIFARGLTFAVVIGALVGGFLLFRAVTAPNVVQLRVLGADGVPLAGATIVSPNGTKATTADGGFAALAFDAPAMISVNAPGYHPANYDVQAIPLQGPLSLQMEANILQGRVTDSAGIGLPGATVSLGGVTATSADFGSFEIVAAEPGTITISKAAWDTTEVTWGGEEGRLDIQLDPFMVKGIRVYAPVAGDDAQFEALLRLADTTPVNTLVFDTKSEGGEVLYDTKVPEAIAAGAVASEYEVEERLAAAKAHGLYTITRIVAFQDHYRSQLRPELAIHEADGSVWTNSNGLAWMDITNEATWQYPIDLGVEACRLGFDEIQYDYARFPTDGDLSQIVYSMGDVDAATRVSTVAAFLTEAQRQIHEEGCAVSADIFAIVLSVNDDQGLGQKVEELSWAVDAISPMIYPSHYSNGWLNFDNPNDHPAAVVGQALDAGMPRLEGGALMRPWLQAFSWSADQVQASILAAESSGSGWMLWNALSQFEQAYIPDE
ncbi:MAG TPA: putative glycoside hydrolase [Acidimicrobiia bacterium]|nr:putative glycoside hydrolase [Acidimicrobiia bacterium]